MRPIRASLLVGACSLLLASPPIARTAVAFQVQGVFQFGPAHVGIAFTDTVNVAQALQLQRYTLTPQSGAPSVTLQTVALQENHRTVVLRCTEALPQGATYTVAIDGLTSKHGDPLEAGGPDAFTTASETVLGIADVHADINALIGQSVSVIGQVYIREGSVTGTPSGYIQDGTGRGLNIFGGALTPALDSLGSVVLVTGVAGLYYTTVEVTNPTAVTALASHVPHLGPRVLTVAQASSSQWEGTYIQVTANLNGEPTMSGSNHVSYPATDGTIPFIYRVRNSTGINPNDFLGNEVVTGAGAGSVYQGTYQITVGNAADFYKGIGPGDSTPPVLVEAAGEGGSSVVTLVFSEPVGLGGSTPSNYTVYPSGSPGSTIDVVTASVTGSTVTLTLAAALVAGTSYTVGVSDVEDSAGNPITPGSSISFTASTPEPFAISAAFQFGSRFVGVAFTREVNASQAIRVANYAFTPALAIAQATLQENGRTVILRASTELPAATGYSLAVSGVTSATGETLPAGVPVTFTTGIETVVDIAAIQQDVAAWQGQTVTIVGQVTIPVGSRGGTPSGYLQDGSGRGINLFGGSIQGAVNQLGSVARVTGTVELYFTTTEITSYTATAVASGVAHLGARVMTVAEANSSEWEGTYIETTGEIADIQPSGTSNTNYRVTDAGSSIDFRVGNGLGILPGQFAIGDRVTGRGAGGSFQTTYQINVGNLQDFVLAGAGGPDTTGPGLVSASGADGSARVTVTFSEPVRSNEATLTSNYQVSPSSSPGSPIAVEQVVMALNGRTVTLTLAEPLVGGTSYTVEVANVVDLAGNPIAPGAAVAFTAALSIPPTARLTVPAATLVRNLSRQGELMRIGISGPQDGKATCRVFDLQGRLVRVLFDGRLTGTPRRTLTWDARDEAFEFVPAGLYVCHLLITDTSGATSEDRAPIVVAVRLK